MLTELEETFAICRLPAELEIPKWALSAATTSITRTAEELSIVCPEEVVPAGVEAARGWRCLKVEGPLDLSLTGIAAAPHAGDPGPRWRPLRRAEQSLSGPPGRPARGVA